MDVPRGIKMMKQIMEQNASYDEGVADLLAQENSTDDKRQSIEVNERERNNEMIRISDPGNRGNDQYELQPCR